MESCKGQQGQSAGSLSGAGQAATRWGLSFSAYKRHGQGWGVGLNELQRTSFPKKPPPCPALPTSDPRGLLFLMKL